MNPPQYIPLVEIVPAPWTAPEVVSRTRQLMQSIGQAPVTLNKEANGFLLNRLQYALIMEGWRLVQVCLSWNFLLQNAEKLPFTKKIAVSSKSADRFFVKLEIRLDFVL